MKTYKSVSKTVEALRWFGDNILAMKDFAPVRWESYEIGQPLFLEAGKDRQELHVPVGHWIVRHEGDDSDYWPVDPSTFETTYRPASTWDHMEEIRTGRRVVSAARLVPADPSPQDLLQQVHVALYGREHPASPDPPATIWERLLDTISKKACAIRDCDEPTHASLDVSWPAEVAGEEDSITTTIAICRSHYRAVVGSPDDDEGPAGGLSGLSIGEDQ